MRDSMRYVIGFAISVILVILLIIVLVGGGGNNNKASTPQSQPLESYANSDAQASETIDGPVTAPQTHDQIKITVDRQQITFQHLKGYNGEVVKQQTYNNTEESYTVFLRSLAVVGFTKGSNDKSLQNEQGYCPSGDRYVFALTDGTNTVQRYWTTTCGSPKTYEGNTAATLDLFQKQVPNYSDLTTDITL